MSLRRVVLVPLALFLLLAVTPAPAVQTSGDAPSLAVTTCLIGSHPNLVQDAHGLINAGLLVSFKNDGSQIYKRIVWRARYGNGWIDFNDVGTFSPGIPILNGLYVPNSTLAGPMPFSEYQNSGEAGDCEAVLTESSDGTVWAAKDFSDQPYSIPEPLMNQENVPTIPGSHIFFDMLGLRWQDGSMPPAPSQPWQAATTADAPPVKISSCLVGSHKDLGGNNGGLINAALLVTFTSSAPQTYKRIVWRARYGNGWIDFNDAGTFSPGVQIVNTLEIENSGTRNAPEFQFTEYQNKGEATDCSIVLAQAADGTVWSQLSPSDPPYVMPYPFAGENAPPTGNLDFGLRGLKWTDGKMPASP